VEDRPLPDGRLPCKSIAIMHMSVEIRLAIVIHWDSSP